MRDDLEADLAVDLLLLAADDFGFEEAGVDLSSEGPLGRGVLLIGFGADLFDGVELVLAIV